MPTKAGAAQRNRNFSSATMACQSGTGCSWPCTASQAMMGSEDRGRDHQRSLVIGPAHGQEAADQLVGDGAGHAHHNLPVA